MATEQPWLRLWTDLLDDRRFYTMRPSLFRRWVMLLCIAKKSNTAGVLPPVEEIAWRLRATRRQTQATLDELTALGLLDRTARGLVPHNWARRQFEEAPAGGAPRTGDGEAPAARREDDEAAAARLSQATAWLGAALAGGPRPALELRTEASQAGISESGLRRAKRALGVQSAQTDDGRGWCWTLPTPPSGTLSGTPVDPPTNTLSDPPVDPPLTPLLTPLSDPPLTPLSRTHASAPAPARPPAPPRVHVGAPARSTLATESESDTETESEGVNDSLSASPAGAGRPARPRESSPPPPPTERGGDADGPDPLAAALVAWMGVEPRELTNGALAAIDDALAQLRGVGATPDEVDRRGAEFAARWPDMTRTAAGLVRHWATLAKPLPTPVPRPARPAPNATSGYSTPEQQARARELSERSRRNREALAEQEAGQEAEAGATRTR